MKTTFGAITQPFLRATLLKKTIVLALLMFYETGAEKIAYKLLSCVICTMIENYVCIDYLVCQSKTLSKIPVGSGGGSKHVYQNNYRILGIGIPYLLINLMSCHGFKNIYILLSY